MLMCVRVHVCVCLCDHVSVCVCVCVRWAACVCVHVPAPKCVGKIVCVCVSHLALTERTLRAVFGPGGPAVARQPALVHAGGGDVVEGVGLAGVGDAARAALPLGHQGELTTPDGLAGHGPTVHLALLGQDRTGPGWVRIVGFSTLDRPGFKVSRCLVLLVSSPEIPH